MTWILLTKTITIALPIIVIIYDIIAYVFGGLDATISVQVRDWGKENPLVAALIGVLFGGLLIHFFQ